MSGIHVRAVLVLSALALLGAAAPATARRPRPITLRVPRFEVPPGVDREVCTFVRVPMTHPFDVAGQVVVSATSGGSTSHHFLMWAYTGTDVDAFRPYEGKVFDSKGCLDMGPPDSASRILIGGAQTPRSAGRMPRGLALRLDPLTSKAGGPTVVGFILNSHWINGTAKTVHGRVRARLLPARPASVKKYLKPIFEVVGNAFIDVAPHAAATVGWAWGPGRPDLAAGLGGMPPPAGPACVVTLSGHMHQWGTLFQAEYVDADGGRTIVYENRDYDHPGQTLFSPALLVRPGERIDYRCTHDNGVERPQRLGCEETPGEAPGMSIVAGLGMGRGAGEVAAKPCTAPGPAPAECPATDPTRPGRSFTGNCVEAHLVFGFTSHDEMCLLPGTFYDGNPDAAAGHECDLD